MEVPLRLIGDWFMPQSSGIFQMPAIQLFFQLSSNFIFAACLYFAVWLLTYWVLFSPTLSTTDITAWTNKIVQITLVVSQTEAYFAPRENLQFEQRDRRRCNYLNFLRRLFEPIIKLLSCSQGLQWPSSLFALFYSWFSNYNKETKVAQYHHIHHFET